MTSETESEGTMQFKLRVRSLKEDGGLLENNWVIQGKGDWNPHLCPTNCLECKVNFSRYGRIDNVSGILTGGSEILGGLWKS